MALITCKDCKKEFSTDARRCPHCGAKKPSSNFLLKVFLFLFFLGWIASQSDKQTLPVAHTSSMGTPSPAIEKQADPIKNAEAILASQSDDTKSIVDATSDLFSIKKEDGEQRYNQAQDLIKKLNDKREKIYATIQKIQALIKSQDNPSQWNYFSNTDDMTSKVIHFASVESVNTLSFDFPYSGIQHATLQLRTHPRYGKSVILSIEKGQFLCRFDGCSVLVRFDEGTAIRFNAAEPSDHSTTNLFIINYTSFLSKLLKAKTVRIAAEFYQSGIQTLQFDISNFDKGRYAGEK